jgi:hypothetical protein
MNTVHSQPRFSRPLRAGKLILTVAAAMSVAGIASAANTIGVHFLNGGNVGNTNGNLLLPTDFAGAPGYAQSNWNCLSGTTGTNVSIVDSSGAAISVGLNWSASGTWSQSGSVGVNQGTPDGNLMNSYLDNNGSANTTFGTNMYATSNNNKPLAYFTGLQAWLATQSATAYDIVIYSDGDANPGSNNGGRSGEYWAVNASGPSTNLVLGSDLDTHVFVCDRANFIGTLSYVQVPGFVRTGSFGAVSGGTVSEFWNFPGNYTVLTGLTNDTVLIRSQRFNTRAPMNSVQIIPVVSAEPAAVAPLPDMEVFSGANVVFRGNAAGATPITYQWQKNGTNLTDGGNIFGSSASSLTVSNVGATDVASYDLVVTNPYGVSTSTVASLTIVAPVSGSYPEKIVTNTPYAYWRLNETSPAATNYTAAVDYAGSFTGYYAHNAFNGFLGIAGPQPTDWPGFESGNTAMATSTNYPGSWVIAPPLAMNTSNATICAWIYPTQPQLGFSAILMSRNGSDTADLGFGNGNNIGYTWNNNSTTYNFVSHLVPLTNAWSFVGMVVTPTNAILFCYNTNGQLSATNTTTHTNEAFNGLTFIGCDAPNSAANPWTRNFVGSIDEVSVFNRPLALSEIYNLYKKGLGLNAIPPVIPSQPQSLALFEGRTATFSITASGDTPLSYTWRKNGTNLANGGNITGANTPTLTVSNTTITNDAANYDIVVGNIVGSITSSVATLTLVASNATPPGYEAELRNLNPIAYWRMNETNGSPNVYDYWGGNIATNFNTTLGVPGPVPPLFQGLDSTNTGGAFDGSTSYIDSNESLMNNQAQFSIIGWFNESVYQGARIGLFGQNDVAEFGFHATNGLGFGQLGIYTIGGTALLDQTNAPLNAWNFVAGVVSGTNVSLYLFITNGAGGFQVLNSTVAGVETNYGISAFPFRIGGGGVLDPTGNYFSGSIDEVAVFNRALSVEELSDLYGSALTGGALPPAISSEPSSLTLYSGKTATFSVGAVGTTPVYQWYTNGVAVSDGGNIAGSSTATLTITSAGAGNAGSYELIITNSAGAVTSSVVTLTVITPVPGSYEASVIAMNPFAYWRFNETNGATTAFDFYGGHNGAYQAGVSNGVPGVDTIYLGFETNNLAVETFSNIPNSYVTTPFGSISTNTFTFTAWVYPNGLQVDWAGLLVNRNSGVAGGFNYGGANQNNQQMLGYTWNNNNANTYGFISGLVIPTNEWSFVAVAISPTNAILSLYNAETVASATNAIAHTPDVFGNNWQIGCDNSDNKNDGVRGYNGIIDEVALFRQTLTPAQVQSLYLAGGLPLPVDLTIQQSGSDIIVTWPAGTLLQADNITGPWTTNNATSPYTNTPTASQQFYRVKVR